MLKVHPALMTIGVTATLFALSHSTRQMYLPIALFGLVLGFVRRASGSLVPSILVHATFNAVAFYAIAAQRPGAPEPPPAAPWVVAASVLAMLALLGCAHLLQTREAARIAQEFDLR